MEAWRSGRRAGMEAWRSGRRAGMEAWRPGGLKVVEVWRRSEGLEEVRGSGGGRRLQRQYSCWITCRILDIYRLSNGCPGNTVLATVFSRFMFTDQLPSGREHLSC